MAWIIVNKVKLVDVAKEAGVSKSTVSQFLNGRFEYMSKETKERIKDAVKKFNYVPNNIARSLKTNKTRSIGVIVRDITGFYTSQAIRGMDDYCKANGYDLLIYNSDYDPNTELTALNALKNLRVDALMISSCITSSESLKEAFESDTPVVHFQLEHDDSEKNITISDYKRAAFEATEYLIKLGHRRICFATQAFSNFQSHLERYQGYVDALNKYDIALDNRLVQIWRRGFGFENSPLDILAFESPPTAFFTQHLAITTDLLKVFDKENIRIPDDISLLGFDDIPMAEFFKVPITVIKQRPYEIGVQAARIAIDKIQKPDSDKERLLLSCALVERASCARISCTGID